MIAKLDEIAGGPMEIQNPSQVARNREQIYNVNRKLKRKKSRNTGPAKLPDIAKLYVMLKEGTFVKNLEFANITDAETRPLLFATTDDRMEMVDRYATASKPSSVLEIDMTYPPAPFYVTQFVMPHPLLVWKNERSRHPTITIALGVSYKKEEEDYAFFSDKLRQHLQTKTLVYGTDGEPAIEKPLERNFPIEGMLNLCYTEHTLVRPY